MYYCQNNDQSRVKALCDKYGPCYQHPKPNVISYIQHLPLYKELSISSHKILIVHGSPDDPLEGRLYPDTALPDHCPYSMVLCGHTHYRMVRFHNGTWFINPGSLGQPRDGHGFSYCIIDCTETVNVKFHDVFIDTAFLKERCQKSVGIHHYSYTALSRIKERF